MWLRKGEEKAGKDTKSAKKFHAEKLAKILHAFYYQIGTNGTMVRDHHLHLYLPPATGVHPKKQKHKLLRPPMG